MWVITRSINEYYQEGDYFECVFDHEPSVEELTKFFGDEELAEHVWNGGGRRYPEETWYFLTEIESGEQYKHSK